MRPLRSLLFLLPLLFGASGCALFEHQYVTVRFNSWPIQVYEVNTLRVPPGLRCEITFVEPVTIEIEGDVAAEVNGHTIKVIEGVLWYDDRKHELAEGDVVRIEEDGRFVSFHDASPKGAEEGASSE